MKRRQAREHDDEVAREQGARHRDELLAELQAREAGRRAAPEPDALSEAAPESVDDQGD